MEFAGFFVLVAFLAGFAWLVITLVKKERERKQQWLRFLQELGFMLVESPEAGVIQKLENLRLRPEGNIKITNLHKRSSADFTLYLYDQVKVSRHEHDKTETILALTSAHFSFPHFCLFPRVDIPGGVLEKLTNMMIDWVVSQSMTRIEFPEDIEFNKHFVLAGMDSPSLRSFFTSERRNHMLNIISYNIIGKEGMVALWFSRTGRARYEKPDRMEDIRRMVEHSRQLYSILKN